MARRRLTILHNNDMHGDFMAETSSGGEAIGGLALLSGYINRVRNEEENVLYVIAGDMVQGSMIDSEFKGISTIEVMNYLSPDAATLGNHEFDYGLTHMLFLEKMANFPIVNANLYIARHNKRLMRPYVILERGGIRVLFIGILTEDVVDALGRDKDVGTLISLEEARAEVGKICNAYRNNDIDLTVLLTHIGFESDKKLAAMVNPTWGVDLIIGGHSHTYLDQPEEVNGILVAQAGTGTDQIGRFDLVVDDERNTIVEWQWQLVPVNSATAEPDLELQRYIDRFKQVVDHKYNVMISHFNRVLSHPRRVVETELGNVLADGFAAMTGCDVILLGSGSIRKKELGPVVTLGDLRACFPYDDEIMRCTVSGRMLRQMVTHFMRAENRNGEGEYYQVSGGLRAVYDEGAQSLVSLQLQGREVGPDDRVTVGLQGYHYSISQKAFGLTAEQLGALSPVRVAATSAREVIEEYLRTHQNLTGRVEGRLRYV